MLTQFKTETRFLSLITYHENGKKETLENYKNGRIEGTKIEWNDRGRKVAEATFEDGEMMEGTRY